MTVCAMHCSAASIVCGVLPTRTFFHLEHRPRSRPCTTVPLVRRVHEEENGEDSKERGVGLDSWPPDLGGTDRQYGMVVRIALGPRPGGWQQQGDMASLAELSFLQDRQVTMYKPRMAPFLSEATVTPPILTSDPAGPGSGDGAMRGSDMMTCRSWGGE